MEATFWQKLVVTILAGFFAACLIEFYKHFIQGADDAINKGYNARSGISSNR
jgi:hypothetical protein